jgi:3-oxoacyl-[acyl-carrier protein] reductase
MKRALVTGGSSAVGSAVAQTLATAGVHAIVHANRNVAAAEKTVDAITRAGGSAEPLALDLLSPDATTGLEALVDEEPVQIFVHCVGGQRDMPFAAMSREDWSEIIDLNLNTFFVALKPLIVPMMRKRWGRIVAVSSLTAITGNRGQTNYAAAKGGMLALVKSLTREYGSRGLTANVVAPGLIETPGTVQLGNYDELIRLCPTQRAGTPDEVAALIGFLASDAAAYISGQMIAVDGGTS